MPHRNVAPVFLALQFSHILGRQIIFVKAALLFGMSVALIQGSNKQHYLLLALGIEIYALKV